MMSEATQQRCKEILLIYKRTKNHRTKNAARNALYKIMHPYMMVWIKSILRDWRIHEEETQITCYSWDAFIRGLSYYKSTEEVPIPNHFHTYAKYFLRDEVLNKKDVYLTPEFLYYNATEESPEAKMCAQEKAMSLKQFRDFLEEPYKSIFEEAIVSLDPADKYKSSTVKSIKEKVDAGRYYEAKRIMKMVIIFLVGGEMEHKDGKRQ